MLQGSASTAQARHLKKAIKLLRFAKSMKDASLRFPSFEGFAPAWDDLGFLAMSDAAWTTHPDGPSQRGYVAKFTYSTNGTQ